MRALAVDHAVAVDLCGRQLDGFLAVVAKLGDMELLAPSLCAGWSRLDTVVHVRMGVEEMISTCSAPSDRAIDHDAASYWASHPDDRDSDPVAHVLWLRRTASAYARPSAAVRHLGDVVQRAHRRLAVLAPQPVEFQGKIMRSGDFLATWVVELAIHQLDLDVTSDPPVGASLARQTIEAFAGAVLPPDIETSRALLLGLGRVHPSPDEPPLDPKFPISLGG